MQAGTEIETDKETAIWIEDGIMNAVFPPDTFLSIELAKKAVQQRLKLSNNKDFPLYVDVRGVLSVEAGARKYLRGEEGIRNATAAAVHVSSPISKFLANVFIMIDKPEKPIRMFNDRAKALKWLGKFK